MGRALWLAVVLTLVFVSIPADLGVAAQKVKTGFFERLFGGPVWMPPPAAVRKVPRARKRVVAPSYVSKEPPLAAVEVVAKDPAARKILVIGDFVADGVASGLDETFAAEPKLVVTDRANGASGFVRDDHYDWNKALLGILNDEKPDIVVAAFGINDRQPMRIANVRLPVASDKWESTYDSRVEGVIDTLKVYGRPFFWVSAPPVRDGAASGDMAYLNGLYKPRVEAAGGHFVDIWNGFTNASGDYITTGPDIEGQVRALRTGDGVNFTRAGRLKLAFYVDRDVRRVTGIGTGASNLLASTSQASKIEIGPDGKKRLVGPVISLSDPLPGASEVLAGAPIPLVLDPLTGVVSALPPPPAEKPAGETVQYRLIVKGEPPPAVSGRVDDFSWPPGQRQPQAFLAPSAAAPAADPPLAEAPAADATGKAVLTPVSKSN